MLHRFSCAPPKLTPGLFLSKPTKPEFEASLEIPYPLVISENFGTWPIHRWFTYIVLNVVTFHGYIKLPEGSVNDFGLTFSWGALSFFRVRAAVQRQAFAALLKASSSYWSNFRSCFFQKFDVGSYFYGWWFFALWGTPDFVNNPNWGL